MPEPKVWPAGLVIVAGLLTVMVSAWVWEPSALAALTVTVYVPAAVTDAVPATLPVPSPLLVNARPLGSDPLTVSVGFGSPVEVTLNEPATLVRNVAAGPLVIFAVTP